MTTPTRAEIEKAEEIVTQFGRATCCSYENAQEWSSRWIDDLLKAKKELKNGIAQTLADQRAKLQRDKNPYDLPCSGCGGPTIDKICDECKKL
jgi:hypothetical protein